MITDCRAIVEFAPDFANLDGAVAYVRRVYQRRCRPARRSPGGSQSPQCRAAGLDASALVLRRMDPTDAAFLETSVATRVVSRKSLPTRVSRAARPCAMEQTGEHRLISQTPDLRPCLAALGSDKPGQGEESDSRQGLTTGEIGGNLPTSFPGTAELFAIPNMPNLTTN